MTFPFGRRVVQGHCTVEIEQTPRSLHAYAVPEDVLVGPGDVVILHGAPTGTDGAPVLRRTCALTVRRAGWLAGAWTRATGVFHLTSLYEVGFEAKEIAP